MSQDMVKIFGWDAVTLFYGTGNIVTAAADDSIAKTAIGTNSPAGTRLVCSSSEDAANDGTHVVASVSTADKILTNSALTGNLDDDSMVIYGETPDIFYRVNFYNIITGIISSDQDVDVTFTWASAPVGGVEVDVTVSVTGGTPEPVYEYVYAPYLRVRIKNNDTAVATVSGILYSNSFV